MKKSKEIITVPISDMDSIQNLQLSTHLKSKLINNGFTTVSKLSKTISDGNSYVIKGISGIGPRYYSKITSAIDTYNTKNNINPIDDIITELELSENNDNKNDDNKSLPNIGKIKLKDILIEFIIKLIEDENIVKMRIRTPDFQYPNDNILYDQNNNIFFKVSYLSEEFDKYVNNNYNLHLKYMDSNTNLLKIAVALLNDTDIIYRREKYDVITKKLVKYNFHFFKFINSSILYIEFFINKLMIYTNRNIKINISDEIFNKLIIEGTDSIKTNTYEFKNTILNHDLKNLPKETINEIKNIIYSDSNDTIYISSCKNIFQNVYIAVFDVAQRTSKDPFNFDTNHIIGTYQFNMEDKYNGEILISKTFKGNIDYIKDSIVKKLFS